MLLNDTGQIIGINTLEQYWTAAVREETARQANALRVAQTPHSNSYPYFSINDYLRAKRGEPVPIDHQPPSVPFAEVIEWLQLPVDDRRLNEYIQSSEPALSPGLTISQYLQGVGDPAPLYMFAHKPGPPVERKPAPVNAVNW